jgi:small-conductance mechanosensitive channel
MFTQTSDPEGTEADLIQEVGADIQVAVDRWSVGQIGWSDVIAALVVFAGAAVIGWLLRRLVARWTKDWEGPAAAVASLLGQVLSVGLYLFATVIALEILGFSLGPVLMIIVLITMVFLFMQPAVRNLSSGFVLQLRGSFKPDDLVETGEITGIVDKVSTRAVVLVTSDGRTVHVPNNQFVDQTLINYTSVGRRRSEMSILLPERTETGEVAARVTGAIHGMAEVLNEPAPEVVVTGFDGAQPCMRVLFWHAPELGAERAARNHVGRTLATLSRRDEVTLADPSIVVRSDPAHG